MPLPKTIPHDASCVISVCALGLCWHLQISNFGINKVWIRQMVATPSINHQTSQLHGLKARKHVVLWKLNVRELPSARTGRHSIWWCVRRSIASGGYTRWPLHCHDGHYDTMILAMVINYIYIENLICGFIYRIWKDLVLWWDSNKDYWGISENLVCCSWGLPHFVSWTASAAKVTRRCAQYGQEVDPPDLNVEIVPLSIHYVYTLSVYNP